MTCLSRSGSSVTAGRACGYDREFAVRFSFILSVPAILGAAVFELPEAWKGGIPSADLPACAAGAFTALVCGVAAIKLLTAIARKRGFTFFSFYCLIAGSAAVALGSAGIVFPIF